MLSELSTDITERKEMEESRAGSDKFFTMSSEMMIIASSTHFIKINPAAIKILHGRVVRTTLSQLRLSRR
jgi:hypothetical protein